MFEENYQINELQVTIKNLQDTFKVDDNFAQMQESHPAYNLILITQILEILDR